MLKLFLKNSSNLIPPSILHITTRIAGKSVKTQGVIDVAMRCYILIRLSCIAHQKFNCNRGINADVIWSGQMLFILEFM